LLLRTASFNATIDAILPPKDYKILSRSCNGPESITYPKTVKPASELFAAGGARVILSSVWDFGGMSD
jgi:hypothetical protein